MDVQIPRSLAATLSATYGIYNGFELLGARSNSRQGEYLDSGKIRDQGAGLEQSRQYQPYIRELTMPGAPMRPPTDQQPAFIPVDDGNVIASSRSRSIKPIVSLSPLRCRVEAARILAAAWRAYRSAGGDRRQVAAVEKPDHRRTPSR